MSDEKAVASAPVSPESSAAQILEQIREKQRELKAQPAAKPDGPLEPEAPSEPASPAPAEAPATPDKPAETPAESPGAAAPGPAPVDKPEWKAWIEKKGFKSTEDMVRSMRELERELTRKNMGLADQPAPPALQAPAPPPPRYEPPPAQMSEEEIAKRYNLDPDDLRRVGPLAADIASNIVAQKIGPLMAQLNRVNQEVARGTELQSLKEDPAFSDPRVQFEMHRILENDPTILRVEPAPYRFAFNEALRTLGRRILEEKLASEAGSNAPSGPGLPTKPPVTSGGRGAAVKGTPGISAPGQVNPHTFASLPLAEKRKVLGQLGALPKE